MKKKSNKALRYVMVVMLLILLALFMQYQHKQTIELSQTITSLDKHIKYLEQKDEMNEKRDAYMYMTLKDMAKSVTSVKPVDLPVVTKEQVKEEVVKANPITYNETFTAFALGCFFSATQFLKNVVGVN